MPRHSRLQHGDQFRIHERKIIRNVETDYPRALEHVAITALHLCPVRLFHNNDQIRPSDQLGRKRRFSIMVRARRSDFDIISSGKYLLCCGATQPVLAADEKHVLHRLTVNRCTPESAVLNSQRTPINFSMIAAAVKLCWLGFTVVNSPPPANANGSSS
jgi:hypothetical protein